MPLPYGLWRALRRSAARPQQARQVLDDAVVRYPGHPSAWAHLGLVQLDAGEASAALESVQKARDLEPRNPAWPVFVGVAASDAGHPDLAAASLHRALELNPDNLLASQIEALLQLRNGQPEEAFKRLGGRRLLPNRLIVGRALVEIERLLHKEPTPPDEADPPATLPEPAPRRSFADFEARRLFGRARRQMERVMYGNRISDEGESLRQKNEVVRLYEDALSLDPSISRGFYYLGEAYFLADRLPSARLAMERSLKDDKDTPYNLFYMGLVLKAWGQTTEARDWLERAVKAFEKFPEALLALGQLALQEGDVLAARLLLEKAAAYDMEGAFERVAQAERLHLIPATKL